ncbi:hypothetical protein EB796_005155 [Bugula neritina]|uniref:Uncharacterized protein n=1 Tax=Bugula neritina TaxID=10212 RepID=A0A7J7KD05_BUGNE|nr:hypothetical protein EB796_005155 [Bugula neritina]
MESVTFVERVRLQTSVAVFHQEALQELQASNTILIDLKLQIVPSFTTQQCNVKACTGNVTFQNGRHHLQALKYDG